MAIIPYRVDVPMSRFPAGNHAVVGTTILVSVAVWAGHFSQGTVEAMVLDGWELSGLLGSTLLHAGVLHLLGNMIFLWVFGNAVCAKVGNAAYLGVYALLALLAGAVHLVFDGMAAVGASGAINGVVGMFLVWYPLNAVSCYWMIAFPFGTTFETDSRWMIGLWLTFDLLGVLMGFGGVAYWAHLGGFAAGFGVATLMLHLGWVRMDPQERSLYDVLNVRIGPSEPAGQQELVPPPQPAAAAEEALGPDLLGGASGGAGESGGDAGGEGGGETIALAEPPPPRAGGGSVQVSCGCGRTMKVSRQLAGRRIRCPDCSIGLRVPAG